MADLSSETGRKRHNRRKKALLLYDILFGGLRIRPADAQSHEVSGTFLKAYGTSRGGPTFGDQAVPETREPKTRRAHSR